MNKPRVPRSSRPKKGKKLFRKGRKNVPRKTNPVTNVPERASATCSRTMAPINNNVLNVLENIQLANFSRASIIAAAYQKFRITGATLTIKPNMDSYTTVAAGQPQKAYLYYMIDKGGSIPNNVTLETLKRMGARPHQLDEKPFKITWKPGVPCAALNNLVGSAYQTYKTSPYLITNGSGPSAPVWTPSTISHYGVKVFIEQVGPVTAYTVDLECQFEFLKPLFLEQPSSVPAVGMTYAETNTSADGVVGGADGV